MIETKRICDICKERPADTSFKIKQSSKQWSFSNLWSSYETIDVCNECGKKLLGIVNFNTTQPKYPPSAGSVIKKIKESTTENYLPIKPLDIEKMTGVPQWHDYDEPPEDYLKIIVKDADGNEYGDHYWDGYSYWEFTENDDGTQDGFQSDVDVCEWKYCSYKQ